MRVAVLAEFYPRAYDPVLGVWAHLQTLAARDAGAEVTVFVLHRIIPPQSAFNGAEFLRLMRQPRVMTLDGVQVRYLRFVSPPRARFYARWGGWAAPALRLALRRERPFDLIHAHNAIPAGDAALHARSGRPLVVSVHGGDVLWTAHRVPGGEQAVRRTLAASRLVLANSAGVAKLAQEHGAVCTEVVHLGTDIPSSPPPRSRGPLLVTVGHLVARKRHADVIRALPRLPPEVRYRIIGDGPERAALGALASELAVADRVEFTGQLPPAQARACAREAWLFVMPSTDEAFGVAYVEAMAAGIPAIAGAGEPGPEEIAAAGGGIELVPPADPVALASRVSDLLTDPQRLLELGAAARANTAEHFSWQRSGAQTLAAYEHALALDQDSRVRRRRAQ